MRLINQQQCKAITLTAIIVLYMEKHGLSQQRMQLAFTKKFNNLLKIMIQLSKFVIYNHEVLLNCVQ